MLYNDTTWNKLNRFFNIFNPKVYRYLLFANGLLLLWGVLCLSKDKISVAEMVFVIVGADLIVTANMLLHCPKKFFLHKTTAEFEDYISLRPKQIHGKGFWWLKVNYFVTGIQDLKFHQNAFEKLFDVGRVSFSGETTVTAKRDEDRIPIEYPFVICGIRNFSAFREVHSNEPK